MMGPVILPSRSTVPFLWPPPEASVTTPPPSSAPRSGIGALGRLLADMAPEAFPLHVVDVGAANRESATPPDLRPSVAVLAIEPDRSAWRAAPVGEPGFASEAWIAEAVSSSEGEATLHLARKRELSSLLPPNREALAAFEGTDRFATERTVRVHTRPLDDILAARSWPRTDLLKIDVQGLTGPVLDGAANAVGEALVVLAEVEVVPLYEGQRLAWACLEQLREAGLDIVDLRPIRWLRTPDRVRGQRHGRIVFLNALAARPVDSFASAPEALLRSAFILSIYGFADLALAAIDASATAAPERFGTVPERARRLLRSARGHQGRGSEESWSPL